jgi:hypothetical protein
MQSWGNMKWDQKGKLFLIFQTFSLQILVNFGHWESHHFEFQISEVWKSLGNWIEAGPHLSATQCRVTGCTGCQPPCTWHHKRWLTGDRTPPVVAASTVLPSSPYPLLEPHAEAKFSFASSPRDSLEHPLSPGRSHSARPLPLPCKLLCPLFIGEVERSTIPLWLYLQAQTKD